MHPQNLSKVLGGTVAENNYAAVQNCVIRVTGSAYLVESNAPSPYFVHHFKAAAQTIGNLTVKLEEKLARSNARLAQLRV
jgi:hypothetical protein